MKSIANHRKIVKQIKEIRETWFLFLCHFDLRGFYKDSHFKVVRVESKHPSESEEIITFIATVSLNEAFG